MSFISKKRKTAHVVGKERENKCGLFNSTTPNKRATRVLHSSRAGILRKAAYRRVLTWSYVPWNRNAEGWTRVMGLSEGDQLAFVLRLLVRLHDRGQLVVRRNDQPGSALFKDTKTSPAAYLKKFKLETPWLPSPPSQW